MKLIKMKFKIIDWPKLVYSIIICQLAGVIGSFFTASSVSAWYPNLIKPKFNPPNWIFSPVWITLFVIMGISLYLIWIQKPKKGEEIRKRKTGLNWFGIQLFLNALWSIIFFGLKNPLLAFIEIIILWLAILMTMISFYKISRPAAYLLIPYFLWVSFASALNFSIFYLN